MTDRILAIIPCLNEERHVEALVHKLAAAAKILPMRIVIVDGGSTDRTIAIAKSLAEHNPDVLFLQNPKRIQGAAVNLAVATYGDEEGFLIRIDAHAEYPADYCQKLIEEAEKTEAAAVVVAMKAVGDTFFQQAVAAAQNSRLGNGGSAHRITGRDGMWADHGHHALMRVKPFRAVGGYDESFAHNEDAELDLRFQHAGFKIWLTGKTMLTYYPRSTPLALFIQYMNHGCGRARTVLKHYTALKIRQLAPAAVLPAALLALLSPLCGVAIVPLEIWAVFCLGYGFMLSIKAGDLRLAAAGPAAMLMHFAWSLGFWRGVSGYMWKKWNQKQAARNKPQ